MSNGQVLVALVGLGLAGYGLYLAFKRRPTTRERIEDAILNPIEAASGAAGTAFTLAPYVPVLIIVGLFGLAALIVLSLPAGALGQIAVKRAGG